MILKDNIPSLILEDDVIFKDDFIEDIKKYKSDLKGIKYHLVFVEKDPPV
jgi:GR25 family glycosyltransferase involved in LPS biosynthesis